MINKLTLAILSLIAIGAQAYDNDNFDEGDYNYDEDGNKVPIGPKKQGVPVEWNNTAYDIHEYYDNIPQTINMTEARFWFEQIHWFITGVQRGLYEDDHYKVDPRCFGEFYVVKMNEYIYTFEYSPFGNFFDDMFPALYMT